MQLDDICRRANATSSERERLVAYDQLFVETAEHTNLVARSSIPERWERHYHDSTQLLPFLPSEAQTFLDIGSGAGFPVVPLAILSLERSPRRIFTAVDSVGKKARFLQAASKACGLINLTVHHDRAENLRRLGPFDVITARAVTALPTLIGLAAPLLAEDGMMVFPKGRRAHEEIDAACEEWSFDLRRERSETDPEATILLIRSPRRK